MRQRRRDEAARPLRRRARGHEERDHDSSSRPSRSPFLTFFMLLEGPALGRALLRPAARAVAAALAQGRPRHLPHGRRLRDRQPADQPDRRRLDDDRPARSWACRTRSRSGSIVAILDLIPLAGATIAAIIVGAVAFLHSIPAGIVVVVFFIVYQQIENHLLQPLIYGRTVQLSPLVVLIAVLIGAELAGILGALAAIPVAGAIQVVLRDLLAHRRRPAVEPESAAGYRRRDSSGEQPRRHPVAEEAPATRERERPRCSLGQAELLEAVRALRRRSLARAPPARAARRAGARASRAPPHGSPAGAPRPRAAGAPPGLEGLKITAERRCVAPATVSIVLTAPTPSPR